MGLFIENSHTLHAQTEVDRVLMFWMLPNELFGRIIDNFNRTTKEASVQSELEAEKIYFEKLHKRYSKPVHAKENTDVRLGYRVDTNMFLMKAYFTFGGRTVVANTSHIIQTTVAGMLFYRVPEGFYANEDVPEGSFLYEDQFLYEKFVLQPHSAYCVPSGTRYATMTYQKTLFSIHVVAADAALPSELNLQSPTSTRKLNAAQMPKHMYRVPEKINLKNKDGSPTTAAAAATECFYRFPTTTTPAAATIPVLFSFK
ncbi:uncharacterized protein CEXT_579471 [Caerostris extrusa]|uniref:Hexamerin n=1 Tax=Caerostris extrusa TaxID=172846 RepID=A0AAV4V0T3_CAEEX|nr:uncharacterized protein CEXT_579471 [Caerostris extrusa]